ncbi:MAG: hypothetical protein DIU52_010455 [bacterium]|jgi:hypothetical protein|nr:MAG: hypothetical protein DIU52_01560 [bacterium]
MNVPVLMLLQEAAPTRFELTAGALAFMLVSMAAVTALAGWCFSQILKGRRHFDPDGTGPAHSPVPGKVESGR